MLYEGFATDPLYSGATYSTAESAPVRPWMHRGWTVMQSVAGADANQAARQFRDDVNGGAGAAWLQLFAGAVPVTGESAYLADLAEFEQVFDPSVSAQLESLTAGDLQPLPAAALAAAYLEKHGNRTTLLFAGLDPVTSIAISGEIPAKRSEIFSAAADTAFYLLERHPGCKPFLISDRAWHGAGGSAVQELGFSLSAAVTSWRALTETGIGVEKAASAFAFYSAATPGLFLTIAKLRALRLLWSRAVEAAGIPLLPLHITAGQSFLWLASRDVYVNLLRGTAAAFGGALGGANAIHLLPFDLPAGQPSPFSRRLARNVSLILAHEAQLAAVADPAAGCAYIESLTRTLCEKAWALFQQVEGQGGMIAALENGFIQRELQQVTESRQIRISRRLDKITGVSVFPNLQETLPARPSGLTALTAPAAGTQGPDIPVLPPPGQGQRFAAMIAAAKSGASAVGLLAACKMVTEPLAHALPDTGRLAEQLEVLRDLSDLSLARLGTRPPVFMGLLGETAGYLPRLNWVESLLASGGLECIMPQQGFHDGTSLISAFRQNPSPVVCLCSTKEGYENFAGVAAALKKAGAMAVYLTGPVSCLDNLAQQDKIAVDRVLYEGCNAGVVLHELYTILGVEEMLNSAGDDLAAA
jgi:methylmalonyl-CoA mutase